MEALKNILAVLVLFLCMAAIIAVIWYCLFEYPGSDYSVEGTLVHAVSEAGKLAGL